jgi:SAM-dependent methyltransferase
MKANASIVSTFACPLCSAALTDKTDALCCTQCEKCYEKVDDIPVFARNREEYWGWVSREAVARVLAQRKQSGWDAAMGELVSERPKLLRQVLRRTSDEARAAGQFLLSLDSESRVLDIGCGLGAFAFSFARSCREVVAMDLTLEHLQWIKAYADEQRITNIIPVCGGDTPHLPYEDASFDAVVMSGVLEYMALTIPGEPTSVQQAFLRDVARVLKPHGQVYIGIENRMSARYFRGKPEEHTRMRFAALLPRPLSNALHKRKFGREFRVYTYTMSGYRHLLNEAGFPDSQFFYPLPEYSHIRHLLPLDAGSSASLSPAATFRPRHPADRARGSAWGRYFGRSFVIVGSKVQTTDSVLEKLVAAARVACIEPAFQKARWNLNECEVRQRTGKLYLHFRSDGGASFLGKVPLHAAAAERTRDSYHVLDFLQSSSAVGDSVKRILPRVLGHATVGAHEIYLEEWRPGTEVRHGGPFRKKLVAEAVDFLIRLGCDTRDPQIVDEAIFEEQFLQRFEALRRWFPAEAAEHWESVLGRLEDYCREQTHGARLPLVTQHGDFSLTNCLFSPRARRLSTVIDWDFAEARGLPLLDAIRLQLQLEAPASVDKKLERGLRGLPEVVLSEAHRALHADYMQQLEIEERLYTPLAIMYWVRFVNNHYPVQRCRWEPSWRHHNVMRMLEKWTEMLQL